MAGVNLSEESANILATNSGLVGAVTHSCKDEAFLSCSMLQRRMLEIGETLTTLLTIQHPSIHLTKPQRCLAVFFFQAGGMVWQIWVLRWWTMSLMLLSRGFRACWKKFPKWPSRKTPISRFVCSVVIKTHSRQKYFPPWFSFSINPMLTDNTGATTLESLLQMTPNANALHIIWGLGV